MDAAEREEVVRECDPERWPALKEWLAKTPKEPPAGGTVDDIDEIRRRLAR